MDSFIDFFVSVQTDCKPIIYDNGVTLLYTWFAFPDDNGWHSTTTTTEESCFFQYSQQFILLHNDQFESQDVCAKQSLWNAYTEEI